jgi:hypothetical protein
VCDIVGHDGLGIIDGINGMFDIDGNVVNDVWVMIDGDGGWVVIDGDGGWVVIDGDGGWVVIDGDGGIDGDDAGWVNIDDDSKEDVSGRLVMFDDGWLVNSVGVMLKIFIVLSFFGKSNNNLELIVSHFH